MNRIIEEIFEHRRILLQSLEKYGFEIYTSLKSILQTVK